jgi:hypothetical protein
MFNMICLRPIAFGVLASFLHKSEDEVAPKSKREGTYLSSVGPRLASPSKSSCPPKQNVTHTKSSDAGGIALLASFLHDSDKGKVKSKSSSQSLSGMPISRSGLGKKKPLSRQKENSVSSKSDDEYEIDSCPARRQQSVVSGLNVATPSDGNESKLPRSKSQVNHH